MNVFLEFLKFIIYSGLIVIIAKYLLVPVLRRLAESLNLKSHTVGNIAGFATSVPELLTVSFSAFTGLISASAYNIISSNIINLVQYIGTILLNKNQKQLQNKALKIDLLMVFITIIIPIAMLIFKVEFKLWLVPVFLFFLAVFYYINIQIHKLYIQKKQENKKVEQKTKMLNSKKKIMLKYAIFLLVIAGLLYFAGNLLSNTLESLCIQFQVPEFVIGILLGIITSIPELITFLESQKHHKKQENAKEGVIEATNNLLTSNLLNLFFIQAVGIIIFSIFN